MPDYKSPDPRIAEAAGKEETQCLLNGYRPGQTTSKVLNFEGDEKEAEPPSVSNDEESFKDLQKVENRRSSQLERRSSKPTKQFLIEEAYGGARPAKSAESEHMVEWADVTEHREEETVVDDVPKQEKSRVFSLSGFTDKVKFVIPEKITG